MLKIKTRTGREVTVTHDHSLFAPTKKFEIAPIECKDLKIGSQIVIPSYMLCGFNDIRHVISLTFRADTPVPPAVKLSFAILTVTPS